MRETAGTSMSRASFRSTLAPFTRFEVVEPVLRGAAQPTCSVARTVARRS